MSNSSNPKTRRELLKWMGGSAALLSVGGLTACSDSGSEPPKAAAKPAPPPEPQAATTPVNAASTTPETEPPAPKAPEPAENLAQVPEDPVEPPTPPADGEMPKLAENDAQAQALGYRSDTNTVDASRFPNHAADQACANCTLFAGQAGDEWGPCGIFPGRQVNAGGWCSAYSRKA